MTDTNNVTGSERTDDQHVLDLSASRAVRVYDTDSTEEELPELPSQEDDLELEQGSTQEVPGLDDELAALLDDDQTETVSPQFAQEFETNFGMSVTEAKELVQELVSERQERGIRTMHQELMQHWGVDGNEMQRRLGEVRRIWDKLPSDKKEQFDSVQGAISMWSRLETGKGKVPTMDRSSSNTNAGGTKYWYTAQQVRQLQKDPVEYAKHADRIMQAWATGRIKN